RGGSRGAQKWTDVAVGDVVGGQFRKHLRIFEASSQHTVETCASIACVRCLKTSGEGLIDSSHDVGADSRVEGVCTDVEIRASIADHDVSMSASILTAADLDEPFAGDIAEVRC